MQHRREQQAPHLPDRRRISRVFIATEMLWKSEIRGRTLGQQERCNVVALGDDLDMVVPGAGIGVKHRAPTRVCLGWAAASLCRLAKIQLSNAVGYRGVQG